MDATVLVWKDPAQAAQPLRAAPLPSDELEALWGALAGADAEQAYRAIWTLAGAAEQAVPLLASRLQPAPRKVGQPPDEKQSFDRPTAAPSGQPLRALRAVEVLEQAGTAEALRFLAVLAEGAAEGRTSEEARAALRRLDRRLDAAR